MRYFSTTTLHSSPHVDDAHISEVRMMGRVAPATCTVISTRLLVAAAVKLLPLLSMVTGAVVGVGIFYSVY